MQRKTTAKPLTCVNKVQGFTVLPSNGQYNCVMQFELFDGLPSLHLFAKLWSLCYLNSRYFGSHVHMVRWVKKTEESKKKNTHKTKYIPFFKMNRSTETCFFNLNQKSHHSWPPRNCNGLHGFDSVPHVDLVHALVANTWAWQRLGEVGRFLCRKNQDILLPWEPKTFILGVISPVYWGFKTFIFHGFWGPKVFTMSVDPNFGVRTISDHFGETYFGVTSFVTSPWFWKTSIHIQICSISH